MRAPARSREVPVVAARAGILHMTVRAFSCKARVMVLLAAFAGTAAWSGCNGTAERDARVGPAVVALALADRPGVAPPTHRELERARVYYDHARHVDALGKDACKSCHRLDQKGRVAPAYMGRADLDDRDDILELYHRECMACHRQRSSDGAKSGPVTCGECHPAGPAPKQVFGRIAFDYVLHDRHARAYPDDCGACHHVYDDERRELVYQKGAESACGDCHGAWADGDNPSLRDAAHRDCVGCHLERDGRGEKTGPFRCAGCHDPAVQAGIDAPDPNPPRLDRDQPDTTWIFAEGARARLVPFDHALHEPQVQRCSACHHQTLKACKECHRLQATEEGGGVSLEEAYHHPESEHSCVGCHRARTDKRACAGCHHGMPAPPGEAACSVCHLGPRATEDRDGWPAPVREPLAPVSLPDDGPGFPSGIVIDVLQGHITEVVPQRRYEPSRFPHRKIVAALHQETASNRLAGRFHRRVETLCAGCHHHAPADERPAPCGSCHHQQGHATRDKPDLYTAYHRQCIGCHQQMALKQQGCTDCHPASSKERSP